MDTQSKEFTAAYGEAMFYAHLLEDLIALHIYECSWYRVNGYPGLSRTQLRGLSSEDASTSWLRSMATRRVVQSSDWFQRFTWFEKFVISSRMLSCRRSGATSSRKRGLTKSLQCSRESPSGNAFICAHWAKHMKLFLTEL